MALFLMVQSMDIVFEKTALSFFRNVGYKHFCCVPLDTPVIDRSDGLCAYLEVIPFETQFDAHHYYVTHWRQNGAVVLKKEYVEELAEQPSGLLVYVMCAEQILC